MPTSPHHNIKTQDTSHHPQVFPKHLSLLMNVTPIMTSKQPLILSKYNSMSPTYTKIMAATSSPSQKLDYNGYGNNTTCPTIPHTVYNQLLNHSKLKLFGYIKDTSTVFQKMTHSSGPNTHYPPQY